MPPLEMPVAAQSQEASDTTLEVKTVIPPLVEKMGAEDDEPEDKLMDFDDMLPHIGEFGLYQKILFLLLCPFAFFVAFVYFGQIFITLAPEQHWCHVPALANLSVEQRKALSIPWNADSDSFDKCTMYAVDYEAKLAEGLTEAQADWPIAPCQNGWEYDHSEIPYTTIATELNWVCEDAALGSAAQSIFFGGAILGGLVFGWVADRYGRIPALVGTNAVGAAAGIASAFTTSFWEFSVCRFLLGLAFDNCFTMMYILVLEYVGPKRRTFVANMSIALFFTAAACLLPWMAYFIADWKLLCIATSVPLLLGLITPWIVPESARWLVSQGRWDKAQKIMRQFERINGTKVDEKIYQQFNDSCQKLKKAEEQDKTYSVLDLFRSPRLRRITILLIVIWMAISLCFDGHVRNVGSLQLDIFITFTIASATELPADTFLTFVLDIWGRRWLAFGSMVASGVFSLLATMAPSGVATATLALIGRFAINISYNIGLQYAAEVLPTVVRAQGVALIHIMGYVANIIAPFVVYLGVYSPMLPLLILGAVGIVGGVLSLFLPETLDQELPQTLADGEDFGRGQKFFEFPCCKKEIVEPQPEVFRRANSSRASLRTSIRGDVYRSSMIQRRSASRQSKIASNA